MRDFDILYQLIKSYAFINQICDKVKYAIEVFEILRDLAYEIQDHRLIMESYKCLGAVLQKDKRYEDAVVCFKKILLYAWYFNDTKWEMIAYENLSTQYFYLGEIQDSRHYNERANRGITEANTSQNKIIAK